MESLQRTANRGSISTGFDISNSLKFEADNTEYLHFTPSSQTDYERLAFSVWVKRTEISTTQTIAEFGNGTADTTQLRIGFDTNDRLFCYGNSTIWRQTNRVFRDTSAYYHLFFLFDTTTPGGVSNNRIRIWVNGSMIAHTDFGVINNPGSGSSMGFNRTTQQSIGAQREDGPKNYFCGYMSQVWASGGTPPVVTDFGEYDEDTNIWKPINISGVSVPDANGFFLDFSSSSDLGNDSSSNNNDFTLVNIAAIDQATDSPTNNFCTFNAIQNYTPSTVLSDGGTLWDNPAGQNWQTITGTFAVASGKWYWEVRGATYAFLGIVDVADSVVPTNPNGYYLGYGDNNSATTKSIGMYSINGQVYNAPSGSPDGTSYTSSSMIGFALDMDNRKMWISKDGTWISTIGDPTGTPSGGIDLTYLGDYVYPAASVSASNGVICAFGGIVSPHVSHHNMTNTDANGYGAFKTAPPANYYSLCSKNLAEYG